MSEYLLSLAIPTYNRSQFLEQSLERIFQQTVGKELSLELIVSDNCSLDRTPEVVEDFIKKGLKIKYIRNSENIGSDRNFIQCARLAQGKYVWVLGDDDFLKDTILVEIIEYLNSTDVGLLHLKTNPEGDTGFVQFTNAEEFILKVSFWITFISSNIVKSDYVSRVNLDQYIGSYFCLIPLYFKAALSEPSNSICYKKAFDLGADDSDNGGYNYFQVFAVNYLAFCKENVFKGNLSKAYYKIERRNLFLNHIEFYINRLLVNKNLGRFRVEGAWRILIAMYGNEFYFYIRIFKLYGRCLVNSAKSVVRSCLRCIGAFRR